MANGSNFVRLPDSNQYVGVNGRSVPTNTNSIPSGETIIDGVRFHWSIPEEQSGEYWGGFTDSEWYTEIKVGPTGHYGNGRFNSDEDVYNYLISSESGGNLNAVFSDWEAFLNQIEDWRTVYTSFLNAVPANCATL